MKENSIEEDMKILKEIIKGDEDCINAIYSQMKVKNDNDEDIQYFKKEIQSIENIVNNYLKEKARADKLEKEYSIMLSQLDEREINYKRVLKENEELKEKLKEEEELNKIIKNTKLDKLLNISRKNGKTIELAMQLREEILKLPKCRLYGIKNCKNKSVLLTKEEVITVQKIKDKIEELNKKEQKLQNSISAEEREEYSDANISWDLMNINIKREVLQDLIEGRK